MNKNIAKKKYRARSSTLSLPSFSEINANFLQHDARYDKIQLSLVLANCVGTKQDLIDALYHVGNESHWFTTNGRNSMMLSLAITDLIFDMEISLRKITETTFQLVANLTINPTRFFANNPATRPEQTDVNRHRYMLQEYPPASRPLRSKTLDGNDNLVADDRIEEANNRNWNEVFAEEVACIAFFVQHAFAASEVSDRFVFENIGSINWVINSAEVYWEFYCKNAPTVAKHAGEYAADAFCADKRSLYQNFFPTEEHQGNFSAYIFYSKNKSIQLALYAKTDNRIRIECRFTRNPKLIDNITYNNTRFPRSSLQSMLDMMRAMTWRAQIETTPLAAALAGYNHPAHMRYEHAAAMIAVLGKLGSKEPDFLNRLMRDLSTSGRTKDNDIRGYNTFLEKLANKELLKGFRKNRNQPRLYSPLGALKHYAEALKKWSDD